MTKDTEPLPGTVFTPRGVRILKISVGVMTVLLIAGIGALFYGVTLQLSKLGEGSKPAAPAVAASASASAPGTAAVPVVVVESAGPAPYARVLDLGPGKLESVAASGNFAVLHWKGEANDLVIVVDPRSGTEAGRIQIPRH
jgi:hypothetical protein